MKDVLRRFGLHDIPTYSRGTHQIDKVFCSENITESIKTVEMLGYDTSIASDHQPIKLTLTLRAKSEDNMMDSQRFLFSNNAKSVTKYIQIKHKMLITQNIYKRIEIADKHPEKHKDISRELQEIDQILTEISKKSEKKVRKMLDNGWNTEIPRLKAKLTQVNRKIRHLLRNKFNHQVEIQSTIQEKKQLVKQFRIMQGQGYKIRHEEMEAKIVTLEQENPKNQPKIGRLKHLLHVEKIKLAYRKIKKNLNQSKNQEITKIQELEPNGTIVEHKQLEEIGKAVARYNIQHYNQAKNTPLAQYPEQIQLHKNLPSDKHQHMEDMITEFLTQIEAQASETLSGVIDPESWRRRMMKWREDTSTSPSGLHLGHYKAVYKPHVWTYELESEEKKELDEKQQKISTLQIQLLNLALKNKVIFTQWLVINSILLFKDKTNHFLH